MSGKKLEYGQIYDTIKYFIDSNKNIENIYDLNSNIYKIEFTKIKTVKNQLIKVFDHKGDEIYLNKENIVDFEKIPYFLFNFYYLKNFDISELLIKLENICDKCNIIDEVKNEFIYILSLIITIDYKINFYDDEYYVSMFLYNLLSFNYIINTSFSNIDILSIFDNHSIDLFVSNEYIKTFLNINNIKLIGDLKKALPIYKVLIYMQDNIKTRYYFTILSEEYIKQFSLELVDTLYHITSREENILKYRYGFYKDDKKHYTLEEIGEIFNITRERVRQIVGHAEKRLYKKLLDKFDVFKLYYELIIGDKKYITVDSLDNIFDNSNILLAFWEILDIAKYSYKYNIIHNSLLDVEEIVKDIINDLPDYINKNEIDSYPEELKKIIDLNYHGKSNLLIKKHFSRTKLLTSILDERFNRIFRFKDNDLNLLNNILTNEYFFDEKLKEHNFKSILERIGYLPVGNSVYKYNEDFPEINGELLDNIIDYLNNMNNHISYSQLYNVFCDELNDLGIDNQVYFKSTIDDIIKDDFKVSKDYIYKNKDSINAFEYFVNTLNSFNGPFELRDIQQALPQFSKISIIINIDKETNNGLVRYGPNKYIYKKDIKVSVDVINKLQSILENLIKNSDGIVSINNLFIDIYYNYNYLIEELDIFNNAFSLFSLLREYFKDLYNFHRPLIFDKKYESMNVYTLIKKKLGHLQQISFNDIKEELIKMGLRENYTRDELIDFLSDTFVLIDDKTLVNKNHFNLSNTIIEEIKLILNLYLNREKEIDTKAFNSYNIFPKTRYKWNKYLLIGIIKSYLYNDYKLTYVPDNLIINYKLRRLLDE